MAVIPSLSAHDDTSEVSDLRAKIEQQLIAAAKRGRRRIPFGELFKHHGKKVFGVVHWMLRNREDGDPSGDLKEHGDSTFGATQGSTTDQNTVCKIIP